MSRNTVMRRTETMSQNLKEILQENISKGIFLSLQFDESTDFTDTAQLCVFVRMVCDDMSAIEEFLTIISMKGQTRGQDIYNSFKDFISRVNFPIHKLVSITTDGAPAMVGKNFGFVANVCFKIINSIRARSLQRRQYRALLDECESEHGDLLLHTDVR